MHSSIWLFEPFEFSDCTWDTQFVNVLVPITLHEEILVDFDANGSQVARLLHTQVHQVNTNPPCLYIGAAHEIEYCAGASVGQVKLGSVSLVFMSWGIL